MNIGEALNRRSDLQTRIAQLQERVRASVLIQEGDEAPESADDLLVEVTSLCDELQRLQARDGRDRDRRARAARRTRAQAAHHAQRNSGRDQRRSAALQPLRGPYGAPDQRT
jgi:hypothetical protein